MSLSLLPYFSIIAVVLLLGSGVVVTMREDARARALSRDRAKWVCTGAKRRRVSKIHANDYVTVSYEIRWVHLEDEGLDEWVEAHAALATMPKPDIEDGWGVGPDANRAERNRNWNWPTGRTA